MDDEDDALVIYLLVEKVRKTHDITNDNTPLTAQTINFNFCGYISMLIVILESD